MLLPSAVVPIEPDVVKPEWRGVDRLRFGLHQASPHQESMFVAVEYLAGERAVHRVEFKNWRDRALPSEARARRREGGGWTVTTAALFDEGAAHHHLAMNYLAEGQLQDVVVTSREPGQNPEVTRFVPRAARDAR